MPNRRIRRNLIQTTLGAQLGSGDTTITLSEELASPDGTGLPTLGASEDALLVVGTLPDIELVVLTDYTSGATTGTITRAAGNTTALTHDAGTRVALVFDIDDFGSPEDEAVGHGLGATRFPPPWSANAGGLVAGFKASAEDGYPGYTVLGSTARVFLGPNGWQDGLAIGPAAKASGEGIAIGPSALATQYGSISITDYASGQPAAGDIGIGAYLDFGNFDETILGYAYGPPTNIALRSTTRTDASSQFSVPTVPWYYVKLIGPNGQSPAPQSAGSQFVQAGDVVDITFNNDTELNGSLANTTEVRLYAQYGSLGDFDEDWILVETLDVSAASYPIVLTDDGSAVGNDPDPDATLGWIDSGTEGNRVLIGYSGFITSGVQALESVAVGNGNVLSHDYGILLGQNLSTLRDYEARIGGPNHTLVMPGAYEVRSVVVTSDYVIDSGGNYTVVLVDATSNTVDVTLPDPEENGRVVYLKRIDASANIVTLVTPGAETIDGRADENLNDQYDWMALIYHDAEWYRFA